MSLRNSTWRGHHKFISDHDHAGFKPIECKCLCFLQSGLNSLVHVLTCDPFKKYAKFVLVGLRAGRDNAQQVRDDEEEGLCDAVAEGRNRTHCQEQVQPKRVFPAIFLISESC